MPRDQLQEALNSLHEELESEEDLAPGDRAALLRAAKEIEAALADESATADSADDAPLSERMSHLIEDFESSYPRFAQILAKVSEALANLGI